jgi:chromate reductase
MSDNGAAGGMKLLGFSGSLRKEAYSTAILRTLKEQVGDKAEIDIFPLNDLPLYNEDIDQDGARPEVADRFRAAIGQAAGLVIISPEYNYGMTGVLKNAIDWASRPGYNSVLKDKPVMLASSSVAFTGGVRSISQLKETLLATLARPLPIPDIIIADAQKKVQDGMLTDETSLGYLARGVDSLLSEIRMCSNK